MRGGEVESSDKTLQEGLLKKRCKELANRKETMGDDSLKGQIQSGEEGH